MSPSDLRGRLEAQGWDLARPASSHGVLWWATHHGGPVLPDVHVWCYRTHAVVRVDTDTQRHRVECAHEAVGLWVARLRIVAAWGDLL